MALQCFKKQLAIFGNFNFPVNSETSLSMMNDLKGLDFIPSLLQSFPPVLDGNGVVRKILSLTNQIDTQITFNPDRIDFVESRMNDSDIDGFVSRVVDIVKRLSILPNFHRVGLVVEGIDFDVSSEKHGELITKYCPHAEEDNIEWKVRWVQAKTFGKEIVNACLDVERLEAGVIQSGIIEAKSHDSIRVQVDFCTTPKNMVERFDRNNFEAIAKLLLAEVKDKYSNILAPGGVK